MVFCYKRGNGVLQKNAVLCKICRKAAFALLAAFTLPYTPAVLASPPQYTTQVITADSTNSRAILWQTDDGAGPHEVEYKFKNGRTLFKIAAHTERLPDFDNSSPKFCHHAVLTDLKPATEYLYRTVSKNNASAWHELKTAALEGGFKALIFGDSQSTDYAVWGRTARAAYSRHKDAAFFINMGDLVDNGQHAWQWNEWFKNAAPLLENLPAAPISGNHENYSLDWKFARAEFYNALFPLPHNGAPGLFNQTYSYEYGDVHFVVLDTQLEEQRAFFPDLFERQKTWLRKNLAACDKPWKIVLMHKNTLADDGANRWTEVGEAFSPIFEAYGVNIVFTAHLHIYGRTEPLRGLALAAGGVIYISTGRSGDDVWPVPKQKPTEVVFDKQLAQTNYLVLEQDGQTLSVTDYQADGTLRDRLVLNRMDGLLDFP